MNGETENNMENKIICPYCEGDDIEREKTYDRYHCRECDALFDEEDIETEDIRHQVSWILDGTDEDNPLECDIVVGEHEAQGLSGLELPHIIKAFQIPRDGTIWFHIHGHIICHPNGISEEGWMNFDDFDIEDKRAILNGLIEQEENDYPDYPDRYPDEYELEAESNRAETEYFNR